MRTDQSLLRIVGEVYASVGSPERWTACLHSIEVLLQSGAANLLYHDHHTHQGGISASTIDGSVNQAYSTYYHALDPWALSVSPGTFVAEEVILGQTLVTHDEMMKTEFYADFGRPFGLTRSLIGVVEATGPITGAITVNRGDASPEFDDEAARTLGVLLPHLRRALALHRRLVGVDAERRALTDVLDRFRAAVLLVDGSQRVVIMNRAASLLAEARDGFAVERGRVCGATPAVTAALGAAFASAMASACGKAIHIARAHVALPRPSGAVSLDAVVLPLAPLDMRDAMAALFITNPAEEPQLPGRVLADRFGLSPAEARVAKALSEGQTVREIAEQLHLTEQTTRWYVKQVLAKTGTSTQAQIVRVLLSMTAGLVRTED